MTTELRIVFMGTPEFAVGILDTIRKNNYNVVGVVTAADKPAGRGQKIKYSAVKQYAMDNGLPLLQPTNLKDEGFLADLKAWEANLQVVVAFRMLPEAVWRMPALGTFNLHASLLPEYRGAAPINWAIINGETRTGVTTFFIDDKIDTGAIILASETPIDPTEDAGQLHDRLMHLGSQAVIDTLSRIASHRATAHAQPEQKNVKTAYKLNRENCKIDWQKSIDQIYDQVRGLSPYPAAWSYFQDGDLEWNVKIYAVAKIYEPHEIPVGTVITGKKEMLVAVRGGFIKLLVLQFPGKTKMDVGQLLNGMTFSSQCVAR